MPRILTSILPITAAFALWVLAWGGAAMAVTKGDMRRIHNAGPVEITVVYLNPLTENSITELSFEVRMDTHLVNLDDFDMDSLSFLRIDGGSEIKALGWFEPGGGGHHLYGVLKFAGPAPADAKSLQLIIRDVGGIPERIFEWSLPPE